MKRSKSKIIVRRSAKKSKVVTARARWQPSPRTFTGNVMDCKMTYCEFFDRQSAAGNIIWQSYRTNSIFDPNLTGVGHQPSGYDQMAVIFESYVVMGVRYKISFVAKTGNSVVGVYALDNATLPSDPENLIEQGQTEYAQISVGGNPITMTGYINNPALMGKITSNYKDSLSYVTNFGNNPNDPGYLNIWVVSSRISDVTDVSVVVELEYDVHLTGSRLIPTS